MKMVQEIDIPATISANRDSVPGTPMALVYRRRDFRVGDTVRAGVLSGRIIAISPDGQLCTVSHTPSITSVVARGDLTNIN
jgi:hypothetical protein